MPEERSKGWGEKENTVSDIKSEEKGKLNHKDTREIWLKESQVIFKIQEYERAQTSSAVGRSFGSNANSLCNRHSARGSAFGNFC